MKNITICSLLNLSRSNSIPDYYCQWKMLQPNYIYTHSKSPQNIVNEHRKIKFSVRLECNLKRIQTSLIKRKYNESHLIKFIRCIMLIAPWIDFWPKIRCSNFLSVSFYTLAFSGIVLYLCTFKYSSSFHAHTHSLCYFHSSFILSIKVCILIRTQIHAMNKKRTMKHWLSIYRHYPNATEQ